MSATELVLTRHGQTAWHGENRYAGVSDVDLTGTGHAQAGALARWAVRERPDAVVSSPLRRAVETAEPSAAALGVGLEVVEDLRELDFGLAEGRTIAELEAQDPALVAAFRADPVGAHFPGGDDPRKAAARGAAALGDIARRHRGERVLVVAHNTLLRLALCDLLGIELSTYRAVLPHLANTALTGLRWPAADAVAPPALLCLNVPLPDPSPVAPPPRRNA